MKKISINLNTQKIFLITGILTLSSYIILPFLAVYFTEKNFNVTQVGIILGLSSFFGSISGIASPYLEKRLGIRFTILIGILIISSCYFFITIVHRYYLIICIIILQGFGQGIINPLLKKMVALCNHENENIAFRYRYIVLCIAIIVGPIIGNILSVFGVDNMLRIAATGCMLCFFLANIKIDNDVLYSKTEYKQKPNFSLILFVAWSIIVFTVFSVFENVSPLAIIPFRLDAERLFSIMIILNSVLAILFQPLIIILNEKLNLKLQLIIGSLSFCSSYALFAYSRGNFILLITATAIFTVGEAMLIPILDVLISKIADGRKLTGLFAISELKQLGFFIGPVISTYFMQIYNVTIMYIIISITCIFELFVAIVLLKKITD